jgi:hypothetical protein
MAWCLIKHHGQPYLYLFCQFFLSFGKKILVLDKIKGSHHITWSLNSSLTPNTAYLFPANNLCIIKSYGGHGGKVPSIRNLGTKWRWVVSPSLRHAMDTKLGGPHSRYVRASFDTRLMKTTLCFRIINNKSGNIRVSFNNAVSTANVISVYWHCALWMMNWRGCRRK